MPALPDAARLDAIAERIHAYADAVRADADRLTVPVDTARWRGEASDKATTHAHEVIRMLRQCASKIDDAADALHRHAARTAQGVADVQSLHHLVIDIGAASAAAATRTAGPR